MGKLNTSNEEKRTAKLNTSNENKKINPKITTNNFNKFPIINHVKSSPYIAIHSLDLSQD